MLNSLLARCDAALASLAASDASLPPAILASSAGLDAQRSAVSADKPATLDSRLSTRELPGRGRGYVASATISAGDRILVETPLVFRRPIGASSTAATTAVTTADAAFRADVVARLLASPARSGVLRPPDGYPALKSNLAGVSDEAFSRTWAAAAANGFEHEGGEGDDGSLAADCGGGGGGTGGPRFLLYSALSIFNHSCCPSACLDDTSPERSTSVYAIRDVKKGEEITICCESHDAQGARTHTRTLY